MSLLYDMKAFDICLWCVVMMTALLTACVGNGFVSISEQGWDSDDTICVRVADDWIGKNVLLVVRTDGTQTVDSLTLMVDGREVVVGAELRSKHRGHVKELTKRILANDSIVRVSHRMCGGKLRGVLDIGIVDL